MITIVREDRFVAVKSQFWLVRHDLSRGGLPDEIRVLHGTGENLLAGAAGAAVDQWQEAMEDRPGVSVHSEGARRVVEFRGVLRDSSGRGGPVRFVHRYMYSEQTIRNELTLLCDRPLAVRRLTACQFAAATCLDEYVWGTTDFDRFKPCAFNTLGPHYDDLSGAVAPGVLQSDARRPWQVNLFKRGVEGIGWTGDSRQFDWDGGNFKGRGKFSIASAGGATRVVLSPLDQRQAARCPGKLSFSWYLAISNRTATCRPKYREIAISSAPLDSPQSLQQLWKRCGYVSTGSFPSEEPHVPGPNRASISSASTSATTTRAAATPSGTTRSFRRTRRPR